MTEAKPGPMSAARARELAALLVRAAKLAERAAKPGAAADPGAPDGSGSAP